MSDAKSAPNPARYRPETRLVHAGTIRSEFGEMSESLFLTQGFVYATAEEFEARFKGDSPGFIYSRFSNPTVTMFERRMAALEGAEAGRATATGMAAMTLSMLAPLQAGDHVVAARALFGSCRYVIDTLLPRFGVETTNVDARDPQAFADAARPNTKVFFFETPANPTMDIVDMEHVAKLAQAHGITTIVDNAFATSVLQRPLEFGIDIVAYSATKLMDGQGRVLAGAICGSDAWINGVLSPFQRNTGPICSPFNAWVVLKGLETLDLRAHRQSENALKVGAFVEGRVAQVLHPGLPSFAQHNLAAKQMDAFGPIFSFVVEGGREKAFAVLNALELIDISNNIGDSKSLACHPASTTHNNMGPEGRAEMGIGEGMIRLNVGLEDPQDLIEDLDRAFAKAGL